MNKLRSILVIYRKKIMFFSVVIIFIFGVFCFTVINNKYNAEENPKEEVVIVEKVDKNGNIEEDVIVKTKIKVDVKGAVKNPGVYELEEDSRTIDAITAAGGLNKNAYTRYLNLAKRIHDEYVILVNTEDEINKLREETKKEILCENITNVCVEEAKIITSDVSPTIEESIKTEKELNLFVNINTASLDELTSLNGIGVSIAQKIIDYRNSNGFFQSVEDIKNVSGIGEKLYEKIKDSITV